LGGGLTASFTVATGLGGGTSTVADRDRNLALSGDFGTVRIGRFVPAAAMAYHGYTGRVTTSQAGTTYGLGAAGTAGATNAANFGTLSGGSFERNSNQIQYTSPNFSGFVVNVNHGTDSTDDSTALRTGKTRAVQTGLSLVYADGPLSIGLGTNDRKADREAQEPRNVCFNNLTMAFTIRTGATCPDGTTDQGDANRTADVTERKIKADMDWFGGSYNFGVATLFASHVKRKDRTTTNLGVQTTNADIKLNSIGVSVPLGAITLAASTYTGKNKAGEGAADDTKLSGHQLNATYELSKRTVVYAAMGQSQIKRDGTNVGATRKFTSNAVGIMHSF